MGVVTAKSPREDEVRSARERLIADGLLRAAIPASLVAKEIEQSWRRSVSSRIDPEAGPEILGEIDPDSVICVPQAESWTSGRQTSPIRG